VERPDVSCELPILFPPNNRSDPVASKPTTTIELVSKEVSILFGERFFLSVKGRGRARGVDTSKLGIDAERGSPVGVGSGCMVGVVLLTVTEGEVVVLGVIGGCACVLLCDVEECRALGVGGC